jgi:hypothetical protein
MEMLQFDIRKPLSLIAVIRIFGGVIPTSADIQLHHPNPRGFSVASS